MDEDIERIVDESYYTDMDEKKFQYLLIKMLGFMAQDLREIQRSLGSKEEKKESP